MQSRKRIRICTLHFPVKSVDFETVLGRKISASIDRGDVPWIDVELVIRQGKLQLDFVFQKQILFTVTEPDPFLALLKELEKRFPDFKQPEET